MCNIYNFKEIAGIQRLVLMITLDNIMAVNAWKIHENVFNFNNDKV